MKMFEREKKEEKSVERREKKEGDGMRKNWKHFIGSLDTGGDPEPVPGHSLGCLGLI